MGLVGADVQEMRGLASSIADAVSTLESIKAFGSRTVAAVGWHGGDAEGFRSEWSSRTLPSLDAVIATLADARQRISDNANAQERTSLDDSGTGSGAIPAVSSDGTPVVPAIARGDAAAPDPWWTDIGPKPPRPPAPGVVDIVGRDSETHRALEESWDGTAALMAYEMNVNPGFFDEEMDAYPTSPVGNPVLAPGARVFGLVDEEVERYRLFHNKVKEGGEWDHKSMIRDGIIDGHLTAHGLGTSGVDETYLPVPGHPGVSLSHDVWSNVHYGFVGKNTGFSEFVLTQAPRYTGGINDPADDISIRIGYELAEKYAPGEITPEILNQAIVEHLDEYEAVASDGLSSQYRYAEPYLAPPA